MEITKPIILISDFDGTISKKDFFWYAIEKYLKESDIQPWLDYKSGKITHVEALGRIFEKIHVEVEEFKKFILTLPIEECFAETVLVCLKKGIPFHIVSAGADYYINYIINSLNLQNVVSLLSNKSDYSKETGLQFCKADENSPFYSKDFGISKRDFVKQFKDKGYFCIYAGDGTPDFEAAKLADIVFARGTLLELCQKSNKKTEKFDTYCDILDFIKSI